MSKERLEEIKERVLVDMVYYKYLDGTEGHWGKIYTLSEEDYNYLIERVQELDGERDEWKNTAQSYYMTNQELREQNKRYHEALEAIYELAEYDEYDNTLEQIVEEVEKALEDEE